MHYEFIVEDVSGYEFLNGILPKIVDTERNTFRIHSYKGIGRVPARLNEDPHPRQRFLLTQLPKLLNGLGKTFAGYGDNYRACAIVICDLDSKDKHQFIAELTTLLNTCHIAPPTRFCLAIEEGEAWLLGDPNAIKKAYPNAKENVIANYVQDSICGTWELLADAIYPGGRSALKNFYEIGKAKMDWATTIPHHMNIKENNSESFRHLVQQITELAD